jgi:putative addiction module component (TIGR02574 family)
MSATMKSLGIDRLPIDERLALWHEIWDSIAVAHPPGSMLTDAQREELSRRAAEDDATPDDSVPWEQVRAEIQALLRKK